MPADDTTKGKHVDCEQGRAQHRTLRDTASDVMNVEFSLSQGNVLCSASEVGGEPAMDGAGESNGGVQTVKEDVVVHGVKCCC